jgi:UPF0271 protein
MCAQISNYWSTCVKLNCDLGEVDKLQADSPEHQLMPHIDMANIACGFHAGNRPVMQDCITLAKKHAVSIGAHPSYPDRENFGRQSMALSKADICDLVFQQLTLIDALCDDQECTLSYIKPHGALYHDALADDDVLFGIFEAVRHFNPELPIVLLATAHKELLRSKADKFGLILWFEAFADRRYNEHGQLESRNIQGAVLTNNADIMAQGETLMQGYVISSAGTRLNIEADTLCLHGDNPCAIETVGDLHRLLHAKL